MPVRIELATRGRVDVEIIEVRFVVSRVLQSYTRNIESEMSLDYNKTDISMTQGGVEACICSETPLAGQWTRMQRSCTVHRRDSASEFFENFELNRFSSLYLHKFRSHETYCLMLVLDYCHRVLHKPQTSKRERKKKNVLALV